jgi:hypothetical protein
MAADAISLDEAETRALIDERLRERGWEADTQKLRHANGTRPARGEAMAIAEWPTRNAPADYALFVGATCVGVVEGKHKNVQGAVDQGLADTLEKAGLKIDGLEIPQEVRSLYSVPTELESRRPAARCRYSCPIRQGMRSKPPAALKWQ